MLNPGKLSRCALLVMCLGCVVDRGRTERLRRDTLSCPGRVSSGSGDSGWPGCMGEALTLAVVENG